MKGTDKSSSGYMYGGQSLTLAPPPGITRGQTTCSLPLVPSWDTSYVVVRCSYGNHSLAINFWLHEGCSLCNPTENGAGLGTRLVKP